MQKRQQNTQFVFYLFIYFSFVDLNILGETSRFFLGNIFYPHVLYLILAHSVSCPQSRMPCDLNCLKNP